VRAAHTDAPPSQPCVNNPGTRRRSARRVHRKDFVMLKWAIIFAIISLITGVLGFRGVSGVTGTIAKVLFAIFVILFLIALLAVIGVFHIL
jgi:uncharacterized membrane protein YtjA (UPF0391 family)